MLEILILFAGGALVVFGRTSLVVAAYVVIASVATWSQLPASTSTLAASLLVVSALLKLGIAPVGVWLFASRNVEARDLRPAFTIPTRLSIVLALVVAAKAAGAMSGFAAFPTVDMGLFVVFCALGMLVVQRSLLANLLGLLALGEGVTLAGATFARTLPESIELGATFDVLVVTFIGLAIARAFLVHNPLLDIESLRRLRG